MAKHGPCIDGRYVCFCFRSESGVWVYLVTKRSHGKRQLQAGDTHQFPKFSGGLGQVKETANARICTCLYPVLLSWALGCSLYWHEAIVYLPLFPTVSLVSHFLFKSRSCPLHFCTYRIRGTPSLSILGSGLAVALVPPWVVFTKPLAKSPLNVGKGCLVAISSPPDALYTLSTTWFSSPPFREFLR